MNDANTQMTLTFVIVMGIPLLLSLLAVATGIGGIYRARKIPSRKGRSPSIVGITLGAFSFVLWIAVFALMV